MITLIVKGDYDTVFAACRERFIEAVSIDRHPRFNGCIVTVPVTTDTSVLNQWFREPFGVPARPGALLRWRRRQDEPHIVPHLVPKGWDKVETSTEDSA